MAQAWPWLVLAGMGALHGLNPLTGWLPAAALALRPHDPVPARRALLPIAAGHAASVVLVAAAVVLGRSLDRAALQAAAGTMLVAAVLLHLRGRKRLRTPAGQAGLALWCFVVSGAHGTGLMLVPALVPLCVAGAPGAAPGIPGALGLAVAAVVVHTTAMLTVTGLAAGLACRAAGRRAQLSSAPSAGCEAAACPAPPTAA